MKYFALIIFSFFYTSCAQWNFFNSDTDVESEDTELFLSDRDYIDYMRFARDNFLSTYKKDLLTLNSSNKAYLKAICENLANSNELVFNKKPFQNVYIVKDSLPYQLSFPDNVIVISSGLIKEYVRNEGDLLSILVYELLRSNRVLYYKKIYLPIKYMNINTALSLVWLNDEEMFNIDKWAIYVLNRAGYDPYHYLSWIQQKNRHSIDFSFLGLQPGHFTRREYELRNFYISQGYAKKEKYVSKNSSSGYYAFIREVEER